MGFDCRSSTGLEEIETPLLQGTHKILCKLRPKAKEQLSHRRLKTYLLVLDSLLQRHGVAVAHHRDKGTVTEILEVHVGRSTPGSHPTTEPADSRAWLPLVKQLTEMENGHTYEQTSRLKFY